MLKLIKSVGAALAVGAVLMLAACSGTPAEQKAKRDLALSLAVERIDTFNRMGVDPIQLDEKKLLAIDTVCLVIPIAAVELEVDPELIKTVMAACVAIRKAAAAYDPPDPAPDPAPAAT